ncbi:hypothetical protein FRB94_003270 [Tulasnella sp. JGI-2019a]|nr:hypothetical protein FRB94_003270 [Tulasnella sp. JGI-2019a]KAG9033012.1 hypothetical protein FRB95_000674 [Tulasnella sp. JGI-2019a]
MAQSLSTQEIPSLKHSPVTLDEVRNWSMEMVNGNVMKLLQENVDENVEWTFSPPADGPLGKTYPTAGVYTSRDHVLKEAMMPLLARFVEPRIDFELIDLFLQPSEMNDPSERHLTKAVVQLKGSAILKKNGQGWNNYTAYILHFDNQTKKVLKARVYQDTAAINKAFEE